MERLLHEATELREAGWRDLADNIITRGYDIGLTAVRLGELLAYQVCVEVISMCELRQGVSYASALDKEASMAALTTNILGEFDSEELITRRLCHNSGRVALGIHRNSRRSIAFAGRMSRKPRSRRISLIDDDVFYDCLSQTDDKSGRISEDNKENL